jgi:YidC/Oxa1 family membrane protein insertase
MKLYQEHKVNPLAGCLPLVVQLPIFFALFRVLHDAYKHIPKSSELYQALCHGIRDVCGDQLTTKVLDQRPSLGRVFSKGDTLIHHLDFLGIDLQKSATDPHSGFLNAAPYFLLVGIVMLTGFLQTRQAQKRTPQANKQMGTVMKVLPIFFGVISISFPAGLVLYFFVSNLFRLGQQEVIFRKFGSASSSGKSAIDVDSRERPRRGAARELAPAADEDDEAIEAAVTSKPARGGTKAALPPPPPMGGGLRGLFKLPPPPEGQAGGGTPRQSRPSNGATSRPPQPRRANTNKKRKR